MSSYSYICRPTYRSASPQYVEYSTLLALLKKEHSENRALKKQLGDLDEMYFSALQDLCWHAEMLALANEKMAAMKLDAREKRDPLSRDGVAVSGPLIVLKDKMTRLQHEAQGAENVLQIAASRLEKLKAYQSEGTQAPKDMAIANSRTGGDASSSSRRIARISNTQRDNYILQSMHAEHSHQHFGHLSTAPIITPPTSFSFNTCRSLIILNHFSLRQTTLFAPSNRTLESLFATLKRISVHEGGLSDLWQYVFSIMAARYLKGLHVGTGELTIADGEIWITVSVPNEAEREIDDHEENMDAKMEENAALVEKGKGKQMDKNDTNMQGRVESDDGDAEWCVCEMSKNKHDHDATSTTATVASSKSHSPSPTTKFESARGTPEGRVKTHDLAAAPTQPVAKATHAPFPDGLPCHCLACIPIDPKMPAPYEYTGLPFGDVSGGPRQDDDDYVDCWDEEDLHMREDEVKHEDEAEESWTWERPLSKDDLDDAWPGYEMYW